MLDCSAHHPLKRQSCSDDLRSQSNTFIPERVHHTHDRTKTHRQEQVGVSSRQIKTRIYCSNNSNTFKRTFVCQNAGFYAHPFSDDELGILYPDTCLSNQELISKMFLNLFQKIFKYLVFIIYTNNFERQNIYVVRIIIYIYC